eukprot:TRINITY_DN12737_c0_g2_i1.p1 TRINITY_DN12737_c0_g2~~TRINITY_DN12737_c0_g2_i1.p1  ORF type:complete len:226 (-),score=47.57 TRINITY_DN12737_c0_g2_i1:189-866(-)
MSSQASFSLLCEVGGNTLCIELPGTSPDDHIKLLRNLSDAFCDFLEELKPEDEALADMVEKGIADLCHFTNKIEVDIRQREASCSALTKIIDALEAEVRSQVLPQRRVAFRLETDVGHKSTSCEKSHEGTLPQLTKTWRLWPGDAQIIAERDPALQCLLQAAQDAVDADEQEQEQEQGAHSVVPSRCDAATRRPFKLRPIGNAGSSTRPGRSPHDGVADSASPEK